MPTPGKSPNRTSQVMVRDLSGNRVNQALAELAMLGHVFGYLARESLASNMETSEKSPVRRA
jgi:hypothetical protein